MKNNDLKNFQLFLFLILSLHASFGHAQNYFWGNSVSSSGFNQPGDLCVDINGDIISVGNFFNIADIQGGPAVLNLVSNGERDVFVIKYSSNGSILWAKSFGQSAIDMGKGVTTDAAGNIYIVGSFRNTVDLNPDVAVSNFTSNGDSDAFLLKLDANGNYLWAKTFGSPNFDDAQGVAIAPNGEIILTGLFTGLADFDPGSGTFGMGAQSGTESYVLKLNSAGNFLWVKGLYGIGDDESYYVGVDATGNIYLSGNFDGTLDLDPGSGVNNVVSAGNWDIFFLKLDASGNFLWGSSIGNTGDNYLVSFKVDSAGNLYAGGYFFLDMDFDPGPGVTFLSDGNFWAGYFMKLNTNGVLLWANNVTSTSYADVRGLAVNGSGTVYVAGRFTGTIDLIPGSGTFNLTSSGSDDIFTAAYDASGTLLWANSSGGSGNQFAEYIAADVNGNTYSTGYYDATADLNPQAGVDNFTCAGGEDVFIFKLGPCQTPPSLGNINASSSFCQGQTVNFSVAQQAGGIGYSWTIPPGSSIISGQNTHSIQVLLGAQSGNVQVFASGNCANGPVSTLPLSINPPPTVTVTALPATSICAGQSVTLSGFGASSYTYSNGVSNAVPFFPTSSGNYTVTGMDINGCTDVENIFINVNPLPNVGAVANPSANLCMGDILTLNGTGASSYVWDNGVTNGSPFSPSASQIYNVTGTDANGCSQTNTVNITINSDAQVVVQPVNDTTEVSTNAMFFIENVGNNALFQWQQNMGTGFVNLSNFGSYSGVNNDTLVVSNVNMSMNNYGFRCLVTSGNCADTSDFGLLIVTNLTAQFELNEQKEFHLFPNPTNDEINLLVNPADVGNYFIIFDPEGRIVFRLQVMQTNQLIKITDLADGIYYGKFSGSSNSKKIVKISSAR